MAELPSRTQRLRAHSVPEMRYLFPCVFLTFSIVGSQQNANGDIISDFVTLGTGTPISANSGSNPNAATLNDLTGGNEASSATLSRTFNGIFGSFVIDLRINAFQFGDPANIGVDFERPTTALESGRIVT